MELTTAELTVIRDALNEHIAMYVGAERYMAAHKVAVIRDKVQKQIDAK